MQKRIITSEISQCHFFLFTINYATHRTYASSIPYTYNQIRICGMYPIYNLFPWQQITSLHHEYHTKKKSGCVRSRVTGVKTSAANTFP